MINIFNTVTCSYMFLIILVSVVLREMHILLLLTLGSMLKTSILKVEKIFKGDYYSIIYPKKEDLCFPDKCH